jgi:hypothetical protein
VLNLVSYIEGKTEAADVPELGVKENIGAQEGANNMRLKKTA